jgi:proline dehydrogenase
MSEETKKHIIIKKRYDYECGDHCCFEMGYDWYVDGKEVHSSPCEDNALLAILKHFGIDAQIDFCGEDDPLDDPQCTLY